MSKCQSMWRTRQPLSCPLTPYQSSVESPRPSVTPFLCLSPSPQPLWTVQLLCFFWTFPPPRSALHTCGSRPLPIQDVASPLDKRFLPFPDLAPAFACPPGHPKLLSLLLCSSFPAPLVSTSCWFSRAAITKHTSLATQTIAISFPSSGCRKCGVNESAGYTPFETWGRESTLASSSFWQPQKSLGRFQYCSNHSQPL